MKSKVAVLRVSPDRILDDLDRLHDLADVRAALAPGAQTILKDNISWHFPFPGANTNGWGFSLRGGDLKPKTFIDISTLVNAVIVFGLTAAIIYFILVLPNEKLRARRGQPEVPPTDVDLLTEIRDLLRAQQTGGRAEV